VNVTVNPPAGTQTTDYDTSVYATDSTNGHAPFEFKYKLWNSSAPIISATNYAEADVSGCSHCGATSIAFQVVLVSKHTLAALTAKDSALGTTAACTTCNSLAEAFQIIYATDQPSRMAYEVKYACNGTASQLKALRNSGLSTAQIQSRSTTMINRLIGVLQAAFGGPSAYAGLGWTPAINGASQAAALTSNTQPVIDLMSEIQH
jgi:hypothetical protein